MSDLRPNAGIAPKDQRRHSLTEFTETVNTPNTILHPQILIGSSAGTYRRFRQASVSESEEVVGRVTNLPTVPPATILTIHTDPRPNAPSSLHLTNSSFLKKQRMMRLNASLDQRRRRYPRVSHLRTRPMSTRFSQSVVLYPKPAESKSQTKTLFASDPING